ncbi:MAG TPA: hypothetical protein VF786_09320 [Terriglobales bacterium]
MKRLAMMIMLVTLFAPALLAQGKPELDHGEVGAFINYTRLHDFGDTNFYGVGGRVGFNVHPNVQLEAEFAYDLERNQDNSFTTGGVTISNSKLRMVHGLFGPKFQAGTGAIRLFGTVKGGLINFSGSSSFPTQISNFSGSNTDGVLYPGGGLEFFAGPFGLRLEVGDEIYFDHGAHNNLRATFGPQIRF